MHLSPVNESVHRIRFSYVCFLGPVTCDQSNTEKGHGRVLKPLLPEGRQCALTVLIERRMDSDMG